jgi:hypothetical protein
MDSRALIILGLCCLAPVVAAAGVGLAVRIVSWVYRVFAGT